jgi:hypothetical protein
VGGQGRQSSGQGALAGKGVRNAVKTFHIPLPREMASGCGGSAAPRLGDQGV